MKAPELVHQLTFLSLMKENILKLLCLPSDEGGKLAGLRGGREGKHVRLREEGKQCGRRREEIARRRT